MKTRYFVISFLATKYGILKEHWNKYAILRNQGKRGSIKPLTKDIGGKIVLLDWKDKKIIWDLALNTPSGMVFDNNLLFVNSINLGLIYIIDFNKKKILEEINNPNFNKLHGLTKTKKGFLVASTGLDLILEVNDRGKSLFEYWLTDHGYKLDQLGNVRVIDKTMNHQRMNTPSLKQATHVNFARYYDKEEKYILAALFHQGQIIKIDRENDKHMIIMEGLNHPHNINDLSEQSYIICDTDNNKVLVVNKDNFEIEREYKNNFLWVQDAITANSNIYIADADNHRIVEIKETGEEIYSFKFDKEYRIFQILPINI